MSKKEKKAPKEKKPGVGAIAREALLEGKSNEEVLAIVQKKFPDRKTSMASINWYRGQLRQDNKKVKTARELKKAAKKAEEKK